MQTNNKYKSLASNTILFAVATFSSKLLSFFLTPLMTWALGNQDYGLSDLIIKTCNLILPMVYMCITEGIIRYGMNRAIRKTDVYTTGILTFLMGYILLIFAFPIVSNIEDIGQYYLIIYIFVITSSMRSITSHFVRSLGYVKLFAVDGLVTTITTIGFNLLFLLVFKQGVISPALATICADGLSALFMSFYIKSWRYFKPFQIKISVLWQMLRYSLPLVPTAVSWWIINSANQYVTLNIWGQEVLSIYTVATKIPMLLTMVSSIFIQAWQMSAFAEDDDNKEDFFSKVFTSYYALIFIGTSVIILFIRYITPFLASEATYPGSWRYVPFLLLGTSFSCLVTFLGTIYNTVQKNLMATLSTIVGAIINIFLINWLIPSIGIQGASISTFVGYFIVFMIRIFDTRRFMKLKVNPFRLILSILLLLGQIFVCINELGGNTGINLLVQAFFFIGLSLCNFRSIVFLLNSGIRFLKSFVLRKG